MIYFVADAHLTSVFGVDEKWVGAVKGGRYSFVPTDLVNTISARCCNSFFH